jgi:hypothetical protein
MKLKLTLVALALSLSACASVRDALPSPETVRDVSTTAETVCAAARVLPDSPERARLVELCLTEASARELAEAYARCPGAK